MRMASDAAAKLAAMEWDLEAPFTLAVQPQPADIDGLNHTNNAVYVQWCEKVAWAHSESLGLSLADYQRLDRAMAIRRGEYDYLLPSLLGEALLLGTWLTGSDGKTKARLNLETGELVIRDRGVNHKWPLRVLLERASPCPEREGLQSP